MHAWDVKSLPVGSGSPFVTRSDSANSGSSDIPVLSRPVETHEDPKLLFCNSPQDRFHSGTARIHWNLGQGSCSVSTCGESNDEACSSQDDCEAADDTGNLTCGIPDDQCKGVWTHTDACSVSTCGEGSSEPCASQDACEAADDTDNLTCGPSPTLAWSK